MPLTREQFMELFNQGYTVAQIADTERSTAAEAEAPMAPPLGPRGESGFAYTGSPDVGLGANPISPVDIAAMFVNPGAAITGRVAPDVVSKSIGGRVAPVVGEAVKLPAKTVGHAAVRLVQASGRRLLGKEHFDEGASAVGRQVVDDFKRLSANLVKRFGKPKPRVRATPKPKATPKPAPKATAKPEPKSGVTQNKSPVQQRGATKAQLERRQADLAARRTPDDVESKLVGSLALRRPGLESLTHDQKVLLGRLVAQGDEEALAMLQRFVGQ